MKLKNENKEENNSENKSFFEKLKTDKKYKAKVELTGYAIFIVVLVIFLNISNIGNNYNYSDNNVVSDNEKTEVDIDEENSDLLESLDNNYSYDIKVEVKKGSSDSSQNKDAETVQNQDSDANEKQNNENGNADSFGEIKTVSYNGEAYDNNIVINKSFDNNNMTYYKVDKEYYTKDGDKFNVVDINSVYDLLDAKYIEIAGVKEYIEKASLDHYTNYSSGKKEYVYNLKVSDVINSFKGDNLVEINVIIENDTINVKIDYSNLIKITDDSIIECLVTYVYKDIDKVEEFVIIEEDKEDLLGDGGMNDNQGD